VPLHRPARRTADSLEERWRWGVKKLARELVALVSSVSSAKFDNPLSFDQNPHGSVDFLIVRLRVTVTAAVAISPWHSKSAVI
jgi:hypothetical protein